MLTQGRQTVKGPGRRTGGLADSVRDLNPVHRKRGDATGIVFVPITPKAVVDSVQRALTLYRDRETLATVQRNGMSEDFSWDRSCAAYEDLFRRTIARAGQHA